MSHLSAPRDRVVELAAEIGQLGRHLDALGAELLTLSRTTASPQPQPAALEAGPGHAAPPAVPPVVGSRSLRTRLASLSGARLLAWTGGGLTLLGVVLLLALAATRGWVGPPVRVGTGAALGVALVGLAVRLHRRASTCWRSTASRVAAFLGAGLLLLAAGTRYARLVAEADTTEPTSPA